jgi:hypothetical protein
MPPHEAEKRQAELAASSSEDVHLPWHRKLNKCQLEIPTKNISKTIQWVICCFFYWCRTSYPINTYFEDGWEAATPFLFADPSAKHSFRCPSLRILK